MSKQSGFTLIELMVTLAIVAVLAALGFPSYQNYVIRSNRAAAQAFMMDIDSRQKQYMLDARTYAADVPTLNMVVPKEVDKFYTVTITTVQTPPSFTITATPKPGNKQVNDGAVTLDSNGTKTPAGKW